MSEHVDELLASVRRTYAEASTYADRGHVRIVGGTMDGASAVFETKFERRGRILSFRYSDEETISLDVVGDHVEIMPAALGRLARPNNLADAIAVLTGVTSLVAHNVFSMLLPDVIPGPTLAAESRGYRLKETPASPRGLWVLDTAAGSRDEILIGQDMLLRGLRREIVTGTADVAIEYEPRVG